METMVRLAGGKAEITGKVNMKLYMEQAADYDELLNNSVWDKALQFFALMETDHPFLSVRASEVSKWCGSEDFQAILRYMDGSDDGTCPGCGATKDPTWKYCRHCGRAL
jgi:hypothetical protein